MKKLFLLAVAYAFIVCREVSKDQVQTIASDERKKVQLEKLEKGHFCDEWFKEIKAGKPFEILAGDWATGDMSHQYLIDFEGTFTIFDLLDEEKKGKEVGKGKFLYSNKRIILENIITWQKPRRTVIIKDVNCKTDIGKNIQVSFEAEDVELALFREVQLKSQENVTDHSSLNLETFEIWKPNKK